MTQSLDILSILAAIGSVICFSVLASLLTGLTKRKHLNSSHIVMYSLPFSVSLLLVCIFIEGKQESLNNLFSPVYLKVIWMGILSPFLYFTLVQNSFKMVKDTYEAYTINSLWPIIASVLSVVLIPEKILPRQWIGLVIVVIGVLLIFAKKINWNKGHIFALLAAFTFAIYTTLIVKLDFKTLANDLGWTTIVFGFQIISLIAALLYFLYRQESWLCPSKKDWILLSLVGFFSFGIAYPLYFYATNKLGIITSALTQTFVPIFSLGLLAILFKQKIPTNYWWGVGFIVCGNLLNISTKFH
jgi:drug/metabolite transporter (DMT)-like permease